MDVAQKDDLERSLKTSEGMADVEHDLGPVHPTRSGGNKDGNGIIAEAEECTGKHETSKETTQTEQGEFPDEHYMVRQQLGTVQTAIHLNNSSARTIEQAQDIADPVKASIPDPDAVKACVESLRQSASKRSVLPPLQEAVIQNDADAVARLLESGAQIDQRNHRNGATALISAASLGRFEILALLLSKGADVNSYDYLRRTALHHSASQKFPECTQLLLLYGSRPDQQDCLFDTPLHFAAFHVCAETTQILLRHMEDPLEKQNSLGATALHMAAWRRSSKIIEQLCEKARRVDHDAECSQKTAKVATCPCPVTHPGVDVEDSSGYTAFQSALLAGYSSEALLMLKYTSIGANAPIRSRLKQSSRWQRPLHFAARGSSKTLISQLVNAGADVSLLDSFGQSPLDVALGVKNYEHVSVLLEYPAQPLTHPPILLSDRLLVRFVVASELQQFKDVLPSKVDLSDKASIHHEILGILAGARAWERVEILLERSGLEKEAIASILEEEGVPELAMSSGDKEVKRFGLALMQRYGARPKSRLRRMIL